VSQDLRDYAVGLFAPEPLLSPAAWAQAELVVPPEESDEPGAVSLEATPYDCEILDSFAQDDVTDLAIVGTPQGGKTFVTILGVAYLVATSPTPVMWVLPNDVLTKRLSARWRAFIDFNPVLADLKPSDTDKFTKAQQVMDGSTITFANAMSVANTSSTPARVVVQDECDKFTAPSKGEAHSSLLVDKRTQKQNKPKRIKTSSPTIPEGVIWQAFLKGDMREWHVPCPCCGKYFIPETAHIKWAPEAKRKDGTWDLAMVERTAHFVPPCCPHFMVTEDGRASMMRAGKWVPTNPNQVPGHRSYRRPLIIMPWRAGAFREIAKSFLEAKRTHALHDFQNSVEARPYKAEAKSTEPDVLQARCEVYREDIPAGVLALTAAGDVQDDRIEIEILGWGLGMENWSVDYKIFRGDPGDPQLWAEVDAFLLETRRLPISCAAFDSGGHFTQMVYNFTRPREGRRVVSVRGTPHPGKPVVGRPTKQKDRGGALLFPVGTDTTKGLISSHLKVSKPGPGYSHFPDHYDREYFDQLCAEELRTRFQRGFPVMEWHKVRERNEALDVRVYNYAALYICGGERWLQKLAATAPAMWRSARQQGEGQAATEPSIHPVEPPPVVRRAVMGVRPKRPGGFTTSW
jgi:phage terminase large subunit GpA-like protein